MKEPISLFSCLIRIEGRLRMNCNLLISIENTRLVYYLHSTHGCKFGAVLSKLNFCWKHRMLRNQDSQPYFKTATLDLNIQWKEQHYLNGCFYFALETWKYKIKSLYTRAPGFGEIWQIWPAWVLRIVYELITCCCWESLV